MKRIFGFGVALLALASSPAAWADRSEASRAVEQGPIFTVGMSWASLDSPDGVGTNAVGMRFDLRGGGAWEPLYLGTMLGAEYSLGLAYTPVEAQSVREGAALAATGGLGFSLRAYTFDRPSDGMIVIHAGGEAGAGGAMWWSDGPRFAFSAGARLAMRLAKKLRLELDYTIVPHVFTSAPHDWTVRRTEHRGQLGAGIGQIDLMLWATYSETRRAVPNIDGWDRFQALELGAGLGWRW